MDRYNQFTLLIFNIYRSIQKIKSFEMAAFELKGNQVQCVYHLFNSKSGKTLGELCACCNEDKAALSRSLANLENRGIVKKAEGQLKYKCPYFLTESGKKLGQEVDRLTREMVELGSHGTNPLKRDDFYKSLEIIDKNLENICKKHEVKNGKNID